MKPRKLDTIDIKILTELQADGRITNQALSERVGLSARPCLERVRRLEREGIIVRYQAQVDVRRIQSCVFVLAQISLEKQGRQRTSAFERRLREVPEVIECFEVSGPYDYIAKLVCRDLETYQELTDSWIDDSEMGVARVVSNVVLRPIRDFGTYPVFEEEEA
ncbi:Lrp/AsnC family transcriptional regulator [Nitrospirillum sp. BR 11828]|uniref:Lrp/AsnC family transcriptional regulator n=1 Tax=Nitrospirillum sp. BR 11828 TaxID=3104325 RepID=UPI002ACA966E|nr:Lrp/AsnC family transcriptional regulator [Nitrospirillum sp. BR 11828]MDZ5646279.1 Lrp/AsnC family transcriptional regulator [Nitrospirillum sp. BR 11828]